MRIALITGEFPPMEGGVGAFTQELGRALAEAGHEIHIITSRDARAPDAPRRSLADVREPYDLGYAQLYPFINRWRWPSMSVIADIVLRREIDVVDIQYQAAAFNMRSAAINLLPWRLKGVCTNVVTFHDLRVPYIFPRAGGLRSYAVRRMARDAHGCILTNQADFAALAAQVDTPTEQIPIGSNIEAYRPNHIEIEAVRDELGLATSDVLLGYFGFLNESKGADVLLRALRKLDGRFHLVFIGGHTGASDATNAAFLAQMRALVAELDLHARVHWTGFLSDVRVSAHLCASDMLVMPYRDGASLRRGTLMAGLAHGRPLITTMPAAHTPELTHGENVWVVPPEDTDALVQAINAVAADAALRGKLGDAAAAVAENFTWDKIAVRTLDFFMRLRQSGSETRKRQIS